MARRGVQRTEQEWRKIIYDVEKLVSSGSGIQEACKSVRVPHASFNYAAAKFGSKLAIPTTIRRLAARAKNKPMKTKAQGRMTEGRMVKFTQTTPGNFVPVSDVEVSLMVGGVKVCCQLRDLKAVIQELQS